MVKAIIGEETQLKIAEDRLSNSGVLCQVGLVIGKISSVLDRGFVFELVPTPPNDAGEAACSVVDAVRDDGRRKGSKGKSTGISDSASVVVDRDWVAEHARQVSRMLVGGIKVIGIYVWISESAFKNSTAELWQTVKGVAGATLLSGSDQEEMVLIHISYSPRRWTCRSCAVTSNIASSSLKPCDFKMGRVLSSLQKFRCTYNFTIRLPLTGGSTSKAPTFSDVLRSGISMAAKDLKNARAVVNGNLALDDVPTTSDDYHEMELLVPFMKDTCIEASSLSDVVGILFFSGSISSYAFINSKEPISQAISDIKDDIITSLQSRLDIILDEGEGDSQPDDVEKEPSTDTKDRKFAYRAEIRSLRKPLSLSLPRRVLIPWLAGTFICDYLQPSEPLEVVKDHCAEMMSMEVFPDASGILQHEVESAAVVAMSFWDVAAPFRSASTSVSDKLGTGNPTHDIGRGANKLPLSASNFGSAAAILVLMFAILAGYMLLSRAW
ncbi:hypothetical protein MLD38_024684 [Melastoma candidum]|uniref:Uncharacterized protein n=1 Tax=Melastoma candidum TaxID=119954 RepID=A0ACB9NT05_9MYRT|nr:hypothetical protein MLD38_024684 [Melastoma candidum]